MQTEGIETRIKCRIHDAFVGELLAKNMKRQDLERATRREWTRQDWNRLIAGPTRFPHSIDKLEKVVRDLGYDVLDDGTCIRAGAKKHQPGMRFPCRREVVPLSNAPALFLGPPEG